MLSSNPVGLSPVYWPLQTIDLPFLILTPDVSMRVADSPSDICASFAADLRAVERVLVRVQRKRT